MKNNYIRVVELAQLNKNLIYLDDEDFGIKLNLLYMDACGTHPIPDACCAGSIRTHARRAHPPRSRISP